MTDPTMPTHPESQPLETPQRPRHVSRPRALAAARWWLPTAILISLLVNALMWFRVVPIMWLWSQVDIPPMASGSGPVSVEVRPLPNNAPGEEPKAVAEASRPDTPKALPLPKTTQTPQPTAKAPEAKPKPQPTPVAPTQAPVQETPQEQEQPEQPVPQPSTPVTVPQTPVLRQPQAPTVTLPETTPTRTETITVRPAPQATGGIVPDRLEVPLPQGDLTGSPDMERTPRPLAASATPSPLPPRTLEKIEGRGGGGEGASTRPETPTVVNTGRPAPGVGAGIGGADGGKGGGTGGGKGADVGAGAGMAEGSGLGINRGIPFGDKTGIVGGDVRGGGGTGGGPGGSVGGGAGSGGGPRFTLGRKSGGGPPVHIVYVLDVSGSMDEGGKMTRAREAMQKALSELHPDDSFNIILFSDDAKAAYPSLRPASAFYVSNGETQIDLAEPGGATNFSAAMSLAFAQEGATHIFLMSDGEPTEGETDFGRLRDMIRRRNNGRVHIITLALGMGENFKGVPLLKAIAEENEGKFSYINLGKR